MKTKLIILSILTMLFMYCGSQKNMSPVLNPDADAKAKEMERESKFNSLKEQGDKEFQKMYYMGWINAEKYYKDALELKKDSPEIIEKLFFCALLKSTREFFFRIDDPKTAEDILHRAEELKRTPGPKTPFINVIDYFLEKSYAGTEEEKKTIVPVFKELKNSADTDYKLFLCLIYAEQDWDLLVKQNEFRAFSEVYPKSNLRYFRGGKMDNMNIILKDYPDFIELLQVQGINAFSIQDYDTAKRNYQRILEINPNIPTALFGMGNLYYEMGMPRKAMQYYEDALSRNQKYSAALLQKGVCLHDLGKYEESIAIMDTICKRFGSEEVEAYYYKALNYYDLKNFPETEVNLKKALFLTDSSFKIHILAGLFYFETKEYKESRTYLEKAKRLDPSYPEIYYLFGQMDLMDKNKKDALKNFSTASINYKRLLDAEYEKFKVIDTKPFSPELKLQLKRLLGKRLKDDVDLTVQKLEAMILSFPASKKKAVAEMRDTLKFIKESYVFSTAPEPTENSQK